MTTSRKHTAYFSPYYKAAPSYVTGQLATSGVIARLAENNYTRGRVEDMAGLARTAQRALIEAAETPFIDEKNPAHITLDKLVTDSVHRTAIIAALMSTRARDLIIITALHNPDTAGGVLRTIAREYAHDAVVRANALALWALISAETQKYDWAKAAVTEAQVRNPYHKLSRLICYVAIQEAPILATQGCNDAWDAINAQLC